MRKSVPWLQPYGSAPGRGTHGDIDYVGRGRGAGWGVPSELRRGEEGEVGLWVRWGWGLSSFWGEEGGVQKRWGAAGGEGENLVVLRVLLFLSYDSYPSLSLYLSLYLSFTSAHKNF